MCTSSAMPVRHRDSVQRGSVQGVSAQRNVAVYDGLALHKPDEPWLALGVWSLGRRV